MITSNKNSLHKHIREALSDQLSEYHINTLSNMLFFYYNSKDTVIDMAKFCNIITERIKKFTHNKTISNDNFGMTLSIFIAGIMDESDQNNNEILAQDVSQTIITEIYSNTSPEFKVKLKNFIKTLLSSLNLREIIELISNKPKIVMDLIQNSLHDLSSIISTINTHSNSKSEVQSKSNILENSYIQKVLKERVVTQSKMLHTETIQAGRKKDKIPNNTRSKS